VFFRQGEAMFVDSLEPECTQIQRLTKYDIGDSYIYKNKILILKTASELSFFSLTVDEMEGTCKKIFKWKRFHFDIIQGQIFHIYNTDEF